MILAGANAQTVERFIALQKEAARLADTWDKLTDYRAYYKGEHPVMLTERQKEFLGPLLNDGAHPFAFNLCKVVVDTLCERLKVEGFTGKDAAGETLAAKIAEWLEPGAFDEKQDEQHQLALAETTSYAIVRWDAEQGIPTFEVEQAYDGDTGVTYHADKNGNVDLAVKYWHKDDITAKDHWELRRNIYRDGLIIHQKPDTRSEYGWGPIDAEEGPAVEYWTDNFGANGRSLGIPVIEFHNGASEIEALIGPQNGLNKLVLDLLAAGDVTGFQMLALQYREGVFPDGTPTDDDKQTSDDLRIGPGRAIELWDGTTLTAIPAGDLTQLLNAIRFVVSLMAGVSRTPQYYFMPIGGNEVPSGEALKQLESGLVSRAVKRTVIFGNAWVRVMRQMARLYRAMGNRDVDAEGQIETNWASVEVRNEFIQAQIAEKHAALGVPQEVLWETHLGYTPDDVAKFKRMKAREAAQQLTNVLTSLGGMNGASRQPDNGTGANGGNARTATSGAGGNGATGRANG